tara:strand:+ start:303 stop:1910 length:1608 start_codon:yes stop_codon:yes gene_type:complete
MKSFNQFNEAYVIPIKNRNDIDNTPYKKKEELKDFFDYIVNNHKEALGDDNIPMVVDDMAKGFKIRNVKSNRTIVAKLKDEAKERGLIGLDFGQGSFSNDASGKPKTKKPAGADYEDIIVYNYNKLLGQENHDTKAKEKALTFGDEYNQIGEKIGQNLISQYNFKSPMIQFGAGASKSNLSSFWTSHGATNGTPKTDLYTSNYNVSLKKGGGAQLASGGGAESIATFYAALEYLGETRQGNPQIDEMMKLIEDGFTKLYTDFTATELGDKVAGEVRKGRQKGQKRKIESDEEQIIADYLTTEDFHKKITKQFTDNITIEDFSPFREWFTFECMSGYKKFNKSSSLARASVCIDFNPKNGDINKFYKITDGGKSDGVLGNPSLSSEVKDIAKKIKVFAAWKTPKSNPYSALRVTLVNNYDAKGKLHSEFETIDSLASIIRNEVFNDKIANAYLKEDIHQLDEFAIIRKTISKLRKWGKSVKVWFANLMTKIMLKVKAALDRIKKLGKQTFEKLFEFVGIQVGRVNISVPSGLEGFI